MRLQGKDIYVRNQTASKVTDLCFLYPGGAAPHTVKKIPPHQHQLEFIYDFSIAGAKDLAFYFLDDEDTKFIFHKELDAEHQNQPLYVYISIQDGRRCVRKDPHGKELYQE